MSYFKFKADKLFDGYHFSNEDAVLVSEEDGTIEDIVLLKDAGDDIQYFSGILSPGFINCHCHLELSHMKGLVPKQTGMVDFVLHIVMERHVDENQIIEAMEKSANDMLLSGIVAVGDICNNTISIAAKKNENLYYHNFIEIAGFPPAAAAARFQSGVEMYRSFTAVNPAGSLIPHAPYSVSAELFGLINEFPENKIISIHNQESASEEEFIKNGIGDFLRMFQKMGIDISSFKASGKSSVQTWLPMFTKQQSIILVHNVTTTEEDIAFILQQSAVNKQSVYFCLCPNANLYIHAELPDLKNLIKQDCRLVIGTDSLASNDKLCILEEIKTLLINFPGIKKETFLQWATINGALALGIDEKFGSFEKGKKPGVVLINDKGAVKSWSAKRIL